MNMKNWLLMPLLVFTIASPGVTQEGGIDEGIGDLKSLSGYISEYRKSHDGNYPSNIIDLMVSWQKMERQEYNQRVEKLQNSYFDAEHPGQGSTIPYRVVNKRPNGEVVGSVRRKGASDIISFTDIYLREGGWGYYITLNDEGIVEKVPYDVVYFYFQNVGAYTSFPNQAGVDNMKQVTYSELFMTSPDASGFPPMSKPTVDNGKVVKDNSGPESLVQLSRRVSYPSIYGVEREKVWQVFSPSQPEFTLPEIQAGATKLGLSTQVEKQTLSQLQTSGTPALLFLQDDGRIVTLTAIDDDRAVIVDRGLTLNIERIVLEKRYSGEALVPTKALTQNATIVANDAVREVKLSSLDTEVPQQFVLRNTGTTPITLQLEYPMLGVTESKLSRDTIPPGETATLDLKVKWRSILGAPTQNVLVSIQTNDPIVPRLQLAVLLTPPATKGN